MALKFNTIPTPDATLPGLLTSVQALKSVAEQLTGTQGHIGATRCFVQQAQPQAMIVGDVWIKISGFQDQVGGGITQSDGTVTSVWNGTNWVTVAVAGCFWDFHLPSVFDFSTGGEVATMVSPKLGAAGQVWKLTAKGTFTNNTNVMNTLFLLYADSVEVARSSTTTAAVSAAIEGVMVTTVRLARPTVFATTCNNLTGGAGHGLLNAVYSTLLCERLL